MKSPQEVKGGAFFQEQQKRNTKSRIKETTEQSIKTWLTSLGGESDIREVKLLLDNDQSLPEGTALPDFVIRLWNDPHEVFPALSNSITKGDIRKLIKETVWEQISSKHSLP